MRNTRLSTWQPLHVFTTHLGIKQQFWPLRVDERNPGNLWAIGHPASVNLVVVPSSITRARGWEGGYILLAEYIMPSMYVCQR